MISINGNNILSAYTGGIPVQAIYCYGNKVWPTGEPASGYYYMSWLPSNLSEGTFKINSNTYNFSDYDGYYSWSGQSYFASDTFIAFNASYLKTNIPSISTTTFKSANLKIVDLPNCSSVGKSAFQSCYSLLSISLPVCSSITDRTFAYCSSLQSISLPVCSLVGYQAFIHCYSLQSISLPVCIFVGYEAFSSCFSLQSINLPNCSGIGAYAFESCSSLQSISLPVCSTVAGGAFYNCSSLQSISLPVCSTVGGGAFAYCSSLQSISLPVCRAVGSYAFDNCISLQSISLPVCRTVYDFAFRYCSSLSTITLGYSSVCQLSNSGAFYSTLIYFGTGSIYVPASLVEAYKLASNWSYYSSRIFSIPS